MINRWGSIASVDLATGSYCTGGDSVNNRFCRYESSDCTGDCVIEAAGARFGRGLGRNLEMYVDPAAEPSSITGRSWGFGNSGCGTQTQTMLSYRPSVYLELFAPYTFLKP
jgi:hypothetical protein